MQATSNNLVNWRSMLAILQDFNQDHIGHTNGVAAISEDGAPDKRLVARLAAYCWYTIDSSPFALMLPLFMFSCQVMVLIHC